MDFGRRFTADAYGLLVGNDSCAHEQENPYSPLKRIPQRESQDEGATTYLQNKDENKQIIDR